MGDETKSLKDVKGSLLVTFLLHLADVSTYVLEATYQSTLKWIIVANAQHASAHNQPLTHHLSVSVLLTIS